MKEKIINVLKDVGKPVEIFNSPDGTDVVILPYGGRVLGLFAPGSSENFYWTNTALESAKTAKAFYDSDQWYNSGGDRTWLAPEIDFFFPKFPDMKVYFQPRQLDPGNYQVVKTKGSIQLVNQFTITPVRSKNEVELKLTKSLGPALNPIRYERGLDNLANIEYAGYTLYVSLEMAGDSAGTDRVGLWNLVQMPHGGDLLIPTYGKTEPKIYFGNISSDDLIVGNNLVKYKMRAEGEHKIGIRATAATGRVGYLYQTGSNWALIIRNFTVNPSGEYIDVPWKDTEYLGYSTQACNVNSNLGSFSELEYHIPAIGKGTGHSRCDDAAQVWSFRGPLESIRSVANNLLTPEI